MAPNNLTSQTVQVTATDNRNNAYGHGVSLGLLVEHFDTAAHWFQHAHSHNRVLRSIRLRTASDDAMALVLLTLA